MGQQDILDNFIRWYEKIKMHKKGDQYAPHKPLTLIFALTKTLNNQRWIHYNSEKEQLNHLIKNRINKKSNILYPLVRLKNDLLDIDSLWISSPTNLTLNLSGDLSETEAQKTDVCFGFNNETYDFFARNKFNTQYIIDYILQDNFPESLHDEIISDCGLNDVPIVVTPIETKQLINEKFKRDPNFSKKILSLYDYRCCFCNMKIYLNSEPVGLEAAHIKWKAQGGECSHTNGLSLCPTHHSTFDKGFWSLNENYQILLSPLALVDDRDDIFFKPFIGKDITQKLVSKTSRPNLENIHWHQKNIFKQ